MLGGLIGGAGIMVASLPVVLLALGLTSKLGADGALGGVGSVIGGNGIPALPTGGKGCG